jgi:hypothetical protein
MGRAACAPIVLQAGAISTPALAHPSGCALMTVLAGTEPHSPMPAPSSGAIQHAAPCLRALASATAEASLGSSMCNQIEHNYSFCANRCVG